MQKTITDRKDGTEKTPIDYARENNRWEFLEALKNYLTEQQIKELQQHEKIYSENLSGPNTDNENTVTGSIRCDQKNVSPNQITQSDFSRQNQPVNDSAQHFLKEHNLVYEEQGQSFEPAVFGHTANIDNENRTYREIISSSDNKNFHHDFQAMASDNKSGWYQFKESYDRAATKHGQLSDSILNTCLSRRESGQSHKQACQSLNTDKKQKNALEKAYNKYCQQYETIGKNNPTKLPPSSDFRLAAEMIEGSKQTNGDPTIHVHQGDVCDPRLLKAMAIYAHKQGYDWQDHTGLQLDKYAYDSQQQIQKHPDKDKELNYIAQHYQQKSQPKQSSAYLTPGFNNK